MVAEEKRKVSQKAKKKAQGANDTKKTAAGASDKKKNEATKPAVVKWVPLQRRYVKEVEDASLEGEVVSRHPLNTDLTVVKAKIKRKRWTGGVRGVEDNKTASTGEKDVIDPLSGGGGGASADPLSGGGVVSGTGGPVDDPLSALLGKTMPSPKSNGAFADPLQMFAEQKRQEPTKTSADQKPSADASGLLFFQPWKSKKALILKNYTTNKRIPVAANFLSETAEQTEAPPVERLKSRVEQLEADPESEEQTQFMTQKEYIKHLETHHANLKDAWAAGQRVLALKIAIQCAKMMSDTKVVQFYPSMYVLISELLDTFGDIVFERIKKQGASQLGSHEKVSLPDNFTCDEVTASAKETCRNWFYKTACIRELLPRLYIEMALIRSYRFLFSPAKLPGILKRMSRVIRGIGDPLVACYARAFLTQKGLEFCPDQYQEIICESYDDFLFVFRNAQKNDFESVSHVASKKITTTDYVSLYQPALQWILQNIGYGNTEDVFFGVLEQTKECWNNTAILEHVLTSFNPKFISNSAQSITKLIRQADDSTVPRSQLYKAFGIAIVISPPPAKQRMQILNDVWKVVKKIEDPEAYIDVADVYMEFVLQHFSRNECNTLLKDILTHVDTDQAYKKLQAQLHSIVQKIMKYKTDFQQLFAIDKFLPVVDLLDPVMKQSIAKTMLQSFAMHAKSTSDPVIINSLMDVARILHDSLDSLSFIDERNQISQLILKFISKIDFGNDLEQHLNVYNDCRRSFTNLDTVTVELVSRVAQLALRAYVLVKGKHKKKTSAFVKACLAYCHITIPSLDSLYMRQHLFVHCGQVGLINGLVVHSEAFFKAAISLIPNIPALDDHQGRGAPESTEKFVANFVLNFCSTLLMFPGHPDHGPFYLVKGLHTALSEYKPWETGTPEKARAYFGLFSLFCAYAQQSYPYHIKGIASNDQLYGGSPEFTKEMSDFLDILVNDLLHLLSQIGAKKDVVSQKRQAMLSLDFVNHLVSSLQMNAHSATLVVKLFKLAKSGGKADKSYIETTRKYIAMKQGSWYRNLLQKIDTD